MIQSSTGRHCRLESGGNDQLPKFVSGNRSRDRADENKAVVAGNLAHFGTYIDEKTDKGFTFQIERANI